MSVNPLIPSAKTKRFWLYVVLTISQYALSIHNDIIFNKQYFILILRAFRLIVLLEFIQWKFILTTNKSI